MRQLETRLTQKGQVTIPVDIRSKLGLKPKDTVCFEVEGEVVILRPSKSKLLEGYGAVSPRKRPENWRKVRAEIEEAVAQEVGSEDK